MAVERWRVARAFSAVVAVLVMLLMSIGLRGEAPTLYDLVVIPFLAGFVGLIFYYR